ncbi:MAG: hypothetical protein RL748_2077 [Pseudomonadota bacterium]|jgi:hypothetical protein
MDNAALKDRSFHDDVVLRMIFVGMNELVNALVNKYANADLPFMYFLMITAPTVFFLCFFSTTKQTPFIQDLREFCSFDLVVNTIFIIAFFLPDASLFKDLTPIRDVAIKIIYVALWLRIFWPCQQATHEIYYNWPTFGPIGVWRKFRKTPWQLHPATDLQAFAAYAGIAASGVVGYYLWRYNIRQAEILNNIGQFAILVFIVVTAPPRAKRWWQEHLARIEADRIAKETAERAAAEARQIIMQQAQQSVEFEAARYAAEHQAKAAQDEAAQLRDQLANPPQAEPPPPHPVLAMLDRNSPTFDAGLYLTMLARQERIKHTGKTKERTKQDIYDTLAPIAVELGVTPKWRSKQDQPNRTILDSCIMAGLVGFGDED